MNEETRRTNIMNEKWKMYRDITDGIIVVILCIAIAVLLLIMMTALFVIPHPTNDTTSTGTTEGIAWDSEDH